MFNEYQLVYLKNRVASIPLPLSAKGTILLVHPTNPLAYEVEFVGEFGKSEGTYTVQENDLAEYKEPCCVGLQNLIDNVGQRGISIITRKTCDGTKFSLQSRGVKFGDESKMQPPSVDVMLNLSCSIGIRFCPFCGEELQKVVKRTPKYFEILAEFHEKFNDVHL